MAYDVLIYLVCALTAFVMGTLAFIICGAALVVGEGIFYVSRLARKASGWISQRVAGRGKDNADARTAYCLAQPVQLPARDINGARL